jgi:hypothetical protein
MIGVAFTTTRDFPSGVGKIPFQLVGLDAHGREAKTAQGKEEGHSRYARELGGPPGRDPAELVELDREEKTSFGPELLRAFLEREK